MGYRVRGLVLASVGRRHREEGRREFLMLLLLFFQNWDAPTKTVFSLLLPLKNIVGIKHQLKL
ncbi:MAG: hypothetical protein EAZ87_12665 [Nostocales cyanobacterium]|nr:MAG: hypothetical protein EAZ87_12665 [Nostocales cyanobacterium]